MTITALDYETEYNNRRRVPEHVEINERWALLAAAYRLAGDTRMDQPYGKRERQRYDIFYAADEDAPLVVYVHGGYRQRGDRKDYSFIARELNASGITVALPSYSLCPAVSVMEIADELQLCIATLWKQTKKRPVVVGHSAGGHLAAEMLSRDWSGLAGVPAHLVQRLTAGTARAASPLFRPPPPKGRRFIAAVGGEESDEFLRQAGDIVDAWRKVGIDARCEIVAGTNHFTILDELIRPGSALLSAIVGLALEADAD
jgi:arylformamidase